MNGFWPFVCRLSAAVVLMTMTPGSALSDEGMWLFNHPPRELLKEKYDFDPTEAWLEHLQHAAVRFNSGGSGSFISAEGLVMTNHHVGADALQKLSSAEHDYLQHGFNAKTRADELRCLDLELNVLVGIEDVTQRVLTAVAADLDPVAAEKARRAVMNTIEKESFDRSGLRSDVVTLYQGGKYNLYRYRKYTDVRLVFAPEQAIAFFGGDADNFEYPRYDLDICFFRAYEDGKPAQVEHFLTWSKAGAQDGELVFVAGHPGHTDRLNTVAHLEFLRDRSFPLSLNILRRHEVLLKTFSERSHENARRAQDEYFGVQNSRKARLGGLAGLQDPAIFDRKRAAEAELRGAVDNRPELAAAVTAWDHVAAALKAWTALQVRELLIEDDAAFNSELFGIARELVRLAAEDERPNADRLREFRESNRESLEQQLYSEAPIYDDLETAKLADSLGMLMEMMGADDSLVVQVLDGKSPQQRADALVRGSKLKDVQTRKALAAGGRRAIEASEDPMIALARLIDPPAREVRKSYEQHVEEPLRQAYAHIARAQFVVGGTEVYPDATFTLRLALGVVRGYRDAGREVAPWTTIGGAFRHAEEHGNIAPFALPKSWLSARERLNRQTPLNFVNTADIIGGNSGSPVVNRQGELVGIIFDGNMQSLVLDFVYTDDQARALAVHSSAIVEALRKVYHADSLADEFAKKSVPRASPSEKRPR